MNNVRSAPEEILLRGGTYVITVEGRLLYFDSNYK